MATGNALRAEIGIGADVEALAFIIEDNLIEIALTRSAQSAGLGERLEPKWIVLKVEAPDIGKRRHGVDALLPPCTEDERRLRLVKLGVVPLWDRRGRHHIPAIDQHGIVIGRRN